MNILDFDGQGFNFAFDNFAGHPAANISNFPLQVPQTGFTGVARYYLFYRTAGKFN